MFFDFTVNTEMVWEKVTEPFVTLGKSENSEII